MGWRAAVFGCLAERAQARCIAGSPFGGLRVFPLDPVHRAGNPPRRAGNFLLLRQKKVTKEEALNRTRAPRARSAQGNNQPASAKTRTAALSLLSLSPAPSIATAARLTRGCTPGSPEQPNAASLGRRDLGAPSTGASPQRRGIPGESGVQPTLTSVKVRSLVLVIGTAARAKRVASAQDASGRFRAITFAAWHWCAVQRLSFGDFSLAQQRKVTRPPGRTPGNHTGQQPRAVSP